MPNILGRRLIKSFFDADAKIRFYPSAVDGTDCVEWVDGGRWKNATVVDLAKRIHKFKKMNAKLAAKRGVK